MQSGLGRPLFATQSCSAFPERLLSSACTSWKKIMRRRIRGPRRDLFFPSFFFFSLQNLQQQSKFWGCMIIVLIQRSKAQFFTSCMIYCQWTEAYMWVLIHVSSGQCNINWLLENAHLFHSQVATQNIFSTLLFMIFSFLLINEVWYYYSCWSQ